MKDVILLRAYDPSRNPQNYVCPVGDRQGNTITGQGEAGLFESLTEEEIRSLEKTGNLVTPRTRKKISNDTRILLNTPGGKALWGWLQHHPYLDKERMDETVKSNRSIYYVFDAQKEAEIHVGKTRGKTILMGKIYELSLTDKKVLYEALGMGQAGILSVELLEQAFERKLNSDYDVVKEVFDARDKGGKADTNARKLYEDAKNHRVIEKQSSGMFTYGGAEGVHLGRRKPDVVAFFLLPENGETVIAITKEVDVKNN